jgi:thiol-disulfide isomerase/thioredoxin
MAEIKTFLSCAVAILLFFSCSSSGVARISGCVENADSVVSLWVEDSVYTFPLDKDNFFSGEVVMKHGGFVTFLDNSLNLYLTPGEDLEIYVNALNFLGSLYFRGSLGGINSYLKEQEGAVFFDRDYYALPEEEFVRKMRELIDEKTKLLEAKNFDATFTNLEKERIRYSVAERVVLYPIYRKRVSSKQKYQPGATFTNFLSSFSLNNEDLFLTQDYRSFLLNYVYFQGDNKKLNGRKSSDGMIDYVLSTITNPKIKDFLLTEIVYRYIRENNGLSGAEHLLTIFRREVTDPNKLVYMEEVFGRWKKLLPNKMAPSFKVADRKGNQVLLEQFRGNYLYIMVWATWCVPCKTELLHWDTLQKEYLGHNIRFLTIAVDDAAKQSAWNNYLVENLHAGQHAFAHVGNKFNQNYMIISVPRFILINPEGRIVDANAPRPSGRIRPLLDGLGMDLTVDF